MPAQYMRDEARIDTYLSHNNFLRDINNERIGDSEVGPVPEEYQLEHLDEDEPEPRNATYKENFVNLEKLVLLKFR